MNKYTRIYWIGSPQDCEPIRIIEEVTSSCNHYYAKTLTPKSWIELVWPLVSTFIAQEDEIRWLYSYFNMKEIGRQHAFLGFECSEIARIKYSIPRSIIDSVLAKFNMQESKKGFVLFRRGHTLSKSYCPIMFYTQPDICYLRRTRDYMLVYRSGSLDFVGYRDYNFMSNPESRKSTSGYVFKLGGGAINWRIVR